MSDGKDKKEEQERDEKHEERTENEYLELDVEIPEAPSFQDHLDFYQEEVWRLDIPGARVHTESDNAEVHFVQEHQQHPFHMCTEAPCPQDRDPLEVYLEDYIRSQMEEQAGEEHVQDQQQHHYDPDVGSEMEGQAAGEHVQDQQKYHYDPAVGFHMCLDAPCPQDRDPLEVYLEDYIRSEMEGQAAGEHVQDQQKYHYDPAVGNEIEEYVAREIAAREALGSEGVLQQHFVLNFQEILCSEAENQCTGGSSNAQQPSAELTCQTESVCSAGPSNDKQPAAVLQWPSIDRPVRSIMTSPPAVTHRDSSCQTESLCSEGPSNAQQPAAVLPYCDEDSVMTSYSEESCDIDDIGYDGDISES